MDTAVVSPAGDVSCKMYKLTDQSDCKLQNASDVVELLGRSHRDDLANNFGCGQNQHVCQ
jgi:hypothetical protein